MLSDDVERAMEDIGYIGRDVEDLRRKNKKEVATEVENLIDEAIERLDEAFAILRRAGE